MLLWLHSCVLLWHMLMSSDHAQTDKLSAICTDRHGCTAAEQQRVSCLCTLLCPVTCLFAGLSQIKRESWARLKILFKTLPDRIVFSWFFCFSVPFLRCFHVDHELKRLRQSLDTPQASACQHSRRHPLFKHGNNLTPSCVVKWCLSVGL